MKKKFELVITTTVTSDDVSDFEIVRKNLEILPSMMSDLGLCVDGTTDARLDNIAHTLKEKSGRRGRPKKLAAVH
tara:strand:+ start:166 stop:390 length:225 start_codon:yes stop_codon:yes gene_type:complete